MLDFNLCIKRITAICEEFRISSLNTQIESVRSILSREGAIDVAILGRFKAGKSSFINNLAHEAVLPVGVIPVTSVITRLKYGPTRKATISYQNGPSEVVEFTLLAQFIAEKENPNNEKQVAVVEIELPSLKTYDGLEFVDTPGLGSVFKHNTAVSLEWLPRVGVAIVAVAVDPPLSDQDLELINQLLRFTPKIVILLTKADLLSDEHIDEVLHFVRKQIKERFKVEFPIHLYSTNPKYQHIQRTFIKTVLDPLLQFKNDESRRILSHKIQNLFSECTDFLRIALEASERSEAERETLRKQILGEKLSLGFTHDELRMMTREWMGRTRSTYMRKLSEYRDSLASQLSIELSNQFKEWNFNLYQFTRHYEDWLRARFSERILEISTTEQEVLYSPLKNAETALTRSIHSFQNRLAKNIEEFLGIQVTNMKFEINVHKPSAPDISTSRGFDSHLDLLCFLIPMSIFKKQIQSHFLKQLPSEVEKNLSRLASQWTERINGAILEMGQQAERFISEQVRTMENLLAQNTSRTEVIRSTMSEIETYRGNGLQHLESLNSGNNK